VSQFEIQNLGFRDSAVCASFSHSPASRSHSSLSRSLTDFSAKHYPVGRLSQSREVKLPDKVNLLTALRDQQFQLKRLLDMQLWVSETPKATLEEMEAQIKTNKRILSDIEAAIAQQKAKK
jgi:hypothetical protein